MRRELTHTPIPIKLWLDDLDPEALAQAEHLAALPFAVGHIVILPDAHVGYGMPIGAVLATNNTVVPNAVGVDIGCGMCAVRSSLTSLSSDGLKEVLRWIRQAIPLGFKHHKSPRDFSLMPPCPGEGMAVVTEQLQSARHQLGTLGGGNHFIELQQGDDGHVWLMIHSGSRNLGHKVASFHNAVAMAWNRRSRTSVPDSWQLAGLPADSAEGKRYLAEMQYCIDFALANRLEMMEQVREALDKVAGPLQCGELINTPHNFAAWEEHGGKRLLIHRKGATRARKGELGLIPGSQGATSYIVRGLGNPDSFASCSHGAGRRLGRKQAVRELDLRAEQKRLDELGVVHAIRHKSDLEEAPSAYKDIETVLRNQSDLAEIVVRLRPLAVIKG